MRRLALALLALQSLSGLGCRDASRGCGDQSGRAAEPESARREEPARLAPLASAVVTTERETLAPLHARAPAVDARSPSVPADRATLLAEGWGAVATARGELPLDRWPAGVARRAGDASAEEASRARRRVLRLVHVTDAHLVDDESPTRVANLDGEPPLSGALRPQEGHACKTLDAAVRTINRLHEDDAIDLVVLGGDNIDSAQDNELTWLLAVMAGGAPLACDSGRADDPVPGPGNDPKDPFVPQGLRVPWYWVTGNHDVLVQGNFPVNAASNGRAIGARAAGGTRNYGLPGAPVVTGAVSADPARALLTRERLMARVGTHGLGDYARASHRAFYTVDVASSPVRMIVVDTAAETGGADGIVRRADLEAFVKPELARASAEHKWVVVIAHHATDRIGDGSSSGGTRQVDAVARAEWEALVSAPPVIALLAGHSHTNRVERIGREPRAAWEIETAALADHPSAMRVVEVWDEGGGLATVRTALLDYATSGDPLASEARTLSVLDWTTHGSCCGPGERDARNVVLWTRVAAVATVP